MVEAGIIARNHGFQQILFLSYSKEFIQSFKKKKAPDWLHSSSMADLIFLTQHGISYNMILVLHLVVKEVWSVAKLATRVPVNQCWFSLALLWLLILFLSPYEWYKKKREMNCLWLYEILDEKYVEWTCIKVIISLCTQLWIK